MCDLSIAARFLETVTKGPLSSLGSPPTGFPPSKYSFGLGEKSNFFSRRLGLETEKGVQIPGVAEYPDENGDIPAKTLKMRCRIDLFEALWVVVFLKQSLNFVFGFDSTAQTTHVRTTPKRTNLVGLGLGCSLVYLNPQIHFLTTKKQPLKKK